MGLEQPQKLEDEKGRYLEKTNVKGLNMSVGWDDGYRDYTIHFPDIQVGDEASDQKVYDQAIRIGDSKKNAKLVFDYAERAAREDQDLYRLYKRVERFISDLPEEDEE